MCKTLRSASFSAAAMSISSGCRGRSERRPAGCPNRHGECPTRRSNHGRASGGRLGAKAAEEEAFEYINKVNLAKFADSFPHTLSGGMKQRVAIARGMAMEPDVLLMDEPFAALDALTRRKMQDELLQLWDDTHFTVLFVTHSIAEAITVGSRILLMSPHPGQVKAEINSLPRQESDGDEAKALEQKIHT